MAFDVSPETTHDLTLPVELAGGPSVDVWAHVRAVAGMATRTRQGIG